uniref:Transcriptional repressor rco-1 n=1 Tax=Ganoderma boninense TaxID=34458 RepID=A0A5K1K1V1_9APHY|nr:Transcriptional repressor rco-1 [Ganoderma boninense]
MTPSSVPIPVWYEPAPPPTPHPLLASETDIPDLCFDVGPLSWAEVDMSKRSAVPNRTLKKARAKTMATDVLCSTTPTANTECRSVTDSDSDSTDSSSNESEPESQEDADMKIPKPSGEVGRPGRGGYSLEQVLSWNPRRMSEFKKLINKLVGECLDPTRSVSSQSLSRVASLRDKALNKFPELDQYENLWPVTDAVKQRLKYTSSKARKHAHDAVAAEAVNRKSGKKLRSRRLQD